MAKVDITIIKKKKIDIQKACLQNAKNKWKDAEILMEKGSFASAHPLSIAALEDLTKITMINDNRHISDLKSLIKHDKKAREMIALSAVCYNINPPKEDYDWAEKRIPEMREDCLYTRLENTPNNQFCPDNKYWGKRAKTFHNFLGDAIKKVEEMIEKG